MRVSPSFGSVAAVSAIATRARAASGLAATALALAGCDPAAPCGAAGACLDLAGGSPVARAPALRAVPGFAPPVPDPAAISSTFGPRWKASAGRDDFHPGIDYVGRRGTPVTAIGDGVVDGVYPDGSATYPAGGNVVVVRHALPTPQTFHGVAVDRVYAVYLHLDTIDVVDGQDVVTGQPVGTMGSTGDTEFVHLHFETRVQTPCSLPYQLAHPDAACALGFDPHVHPFLFVGGRNDDALAVEPLPASAGLAVRLRATRGDLDLDGIQTDAGAVGFVAREGIDATSLATLDDFDYGWLRLDPQPFGAADDELAYDLYFAEPPAFLEVRDLHGRGLRWDVGAAP